MPPTKLVRSSKPDRPHRSPAAAAQSNRTFGATRKDTYAFTSPYESSWTVHYYSKHFQNLFGQKVIREKDFLLKLQEHQALPEIMIMGNFIVERAGIVSLCRELGINVVHTEDGFFPHYSTMHADPLGFCWESSLTRMLFRQCSKLERTCSEKIRKKWLAFEPKPLPQSIRPPFVFWPLQLTGDQVNLWDLRVKDWTGLLEHFRGCLPRDFQLVLKEHPRSKPHDNTGVAELVAKLPNTVIIPRDTDIKTLLAKCSAVAGANSTVLYEGRLLFHKPAYVYARGWFTHHSELFTPVPLRDPRPLNRFDWVDDNERLRTDRLNDYTDWFLAQFLARQIQRDRAEHDGRWLKTALHRLSYASFVKYGEEIFADTLEEYLDH
jgi:hypothetical protein